MKKSKVFTFFYRVLLSIVLMFGINSMLLSVVLEKWYLSFFGVMLFVLANVFPSVAKGGNYLLLKGLPLALPVSQ